MKNVQRHDNWIDALWSLTRVLYYFLGLPCLLFLALASLVGIFGNTMVRADGGYYFFSALLWAAIIIPLGYRRFSIVSRRRQLKKMVALLTSDERFSPQKQHQVLDAGRSKYLGIDTKNGTMLYIHMVKKGFVDVIGLTMDDWSDSEQEGSTLRIKTKNPDVPELSINAHQIVTRELFNALSAMSHNSYSEPFPKEPWPLHVGIQSRFVEFEHNVVVPQAANLA
ncbi:plasmid IncI1-type surface exclusion protein ExcA (plasmid) [Pantoea stewartii]|uniref:plasmid IncI1-type surface exclusion protein ExcA n=1 Tax=Pantoea stewartii TaxID=66269 RepID=UPI0013DDE219|nr:plasmid IncI1-type surface exclusion protein ExcA [Pantoea stewartii]QIE99945.1 plasmid IncI1-type surface exclusion protein ExcA [Pantoea stewartii]